MPFKTWSGLDVLTSSDVNTYLMNQALIVCTVATRPSSPTTNMRIWQTDTDEEYYWDGSSWVLIKDVPTFVYKSEDEVKNNTSSLTLDKELFGTVRASAVYFMDALIFTRSPESCRTKIGLQVPLGTQITWAPDNYGVILSDFDHIGYDYVANWPWDTEISYLTNASLTTVIWIRELPIQTGSEAGIVGIKWAQSTSQDNDTIVYARSYLHIRRAIT